MNYRFFKEQKSEKYIQEIRNHVLLNPKFIYVSIGSAIHDINDYSKWQILPNFMRTSDDNFLVIIYDYFDHNNRKYIKNLASDYPNINIIIVQRSSLSEEITPDTFFSIVTDALSGFDSNKWLLCSYISYANLEGATSNERQIYHKTRELLQSSPYVNNIFVWDYYSTILTKGLPIYLGIKRDVMDIVKEKLIYNIQNHMSRIYIGDSMEVHQVTMPKLLSTTSTFLRTASTRGGYMPHIAINKNQTVPLRYAPKQLSRRDRKLQMAALRRSRKLYRHGKYYQRPTIASFKTRKSRHLSRATKLYGVPDMAITPKLAQKTKCSTSALRQIVKKGEGAYYSSGSRPNQTAQSWGYARLASALTGGPSSVVDYHILRDGCAPNSRPLKMARRTCRKMGRKCQ